MRNLRWLVLIAVGGLLLVVGILLSQTPVLQSNAPLPASGGAHVEALIGSPVRLNPILDFNNQVDEDVDQLLYRGLVRFDDRGQPVPDLAAQLAVSADTKLVTVTLRDDAFWHDGEPVQAADVVYTFAKIQEEGYPGPADLQAFWSEINVVLLDERTVQFQLPEPFAPFLDFLSVGLLPDHLLRGVSAADLPDHPFHLEPVGTGPFRFDRYLTEDGQIVGVSLLKNDDFYGQVPYLDRVEFHYFEDQASALAAYQSGEVGAIGSVGPSILPEVLAAPNLNLHSMRQAEVKLIYLNLANSELAFLAEKDVRQSLTYAINRQALIDLQLGGQGIVATGPILPGTWAFAEGLEPVPYDPIGAGHLLDQAGWEIPVGANPGAEEYVRTNNESQLRFSLLHGDTPTDSAIAERVQSYWAAIGIQVELEPVAPNELQEALEEREFEAVLTDLVLSRWPDPDPYPMWHDSQAESGQNYASFEDRNTGIWLERARVSPDQARRAELYASFQYRFQDQAPVVLLFHPVYNYAISADMLGVSIGPLYDPSARFVNIELWHLRTRRGPAPDPSEAPPSPAP
ncbi:MAG TPA: peptide ABC transporter substrate-binding protein [Anaerolineales bacterium]|jgi:peptide/nickel transport system substrate-binding protein